MSEFENPFERRNENIHGFQKENEPIIQEHLDRVCPTDSPSHFYLPHYAVLKLDITKTKVRVVFNT